jgi:hypothetical protein
MAAAAFGGRVILSSLLAEFVDPSLPGPQPDLRGGTRIGLYRALQPLAGVFARLCDGDSKIEVLAVCGVFVALWVLVGHLSLQRYLRLLALIRPVAAALQLYIIHLYSKNFFAYIYRTLHQNLIQQ